MTVSEQTSVISRLHFVLPEIHFFFALQLVYDLADDQVEMDAMGDKVQIVGRDGQHRAEGESLNPALVQVVQVRQVVGCDPALVIAPAPGDAGLYSPHP